VWPTATDKKSVLALEQYFIDTLNPEYNILKIAGCSKEKGRVVPFLMAVGHTKNQFSLGGGESNFCIFSR